MFSSGIKKNNYSELERERSLPFLSLAFPSALILIPVYPTANHRGGVNKLNDVSVVQSPSSY